MKILKLIKYILFIVLFFQINNNLHAQSREYFVKATIIGKFAGYTEWESNSIGENFVICVLGENSFDGELEKIFQNSKIKNKVVKILYSNNYSVKQTCQLLFISTSEKRHLKDIIKIYQNENILLVSDTPGFCEKGVHFNFYYKQNETLHFEINVNALLKAKLKTDMQLLSIGKIIN